MTDGNRFREVQARRRIGALVLALFGLCAASAGEIRLVQDELTGFRKIEPTANPDMTYEHAYRHERIKFELRYAVRPIPDKIREIYPRYEAHGIASLKTGEIVAEAVDSPAGPENYFASEFKTVVLNIANDGGEYVETRPMPAHLAKQTFGADYVRFTRIRPRSTFGAGYREIFALGMHKVGQGSVYVFQLYDDRAEAKQVISQTFAALRFQPSP
jgi:hypothetical protein